MSLVWCCLCDELVVFRVIKPVFRFVKSKAGSLVFGGMLLNTWNAKQTCNAYVNWWLIGEAAHGRRSSNLPELFAYDDDLFVDRSKLLFKSSSGNERSSVLSNGNPLRTV